MAWVAPRAWAPAETVTAAKMNEISSSLNAAGDAWISYAPTLSAATTPPTMGASSIAGRYRLVGKTADVSIEFTAGAGFAAGSGVYRFSLPSGVAPLNTNVNAVLGMANVVDISTATMVAHAYYVTSSVVSVIMADGSTPLTHNSPIAVWATGDRVSIKLTALEIV